MKKKLESGIFHQHAVSSFKYGCCIEASLKYLELERDLWK